jgi:hypothetical protein
VVAAQGLNNGGSRKVMDRADILVGLMHHKVDLS